MFLRHGHGFFLAGLFLMRPPRRPAPTRGCGCSTTRRAQLKERTASSHPPGWRAPAKAAVRFNSGGSGSFVSADGLVMTNHHVGADALQKLSTKDKDYYRDGFYAQTRDEEVKCLDLELNVLMDIEDVTERVNAAVKPGMDDAAARRRPGGPIAARSKRKSRDKTGPAQRRGHALPGRPVPPLPLQEIHRRAAGLRAREGHRLLRRRSRQLRVSALRPRHLLLPRLREWQAGQDRALPEVEPGRREGRRAGLRRRPPGPDRPAEHRGQPGVPPRRRASRCRSTCCAAAKVLLRPFSERSLENARRAKDELFGIRTAARRGWAAWPACRTRRSWTARQRREHDAARSRRTTTRSCKKPAATPGTRSPARSKALGRQIYADYTCSSAARPSTATCSASPARWSALAEETPKPNAERLREYAEAGLRIAQAAALLRGADLRRSGNRQAGRFAGHADGDAGRRQSRWSSRCWPASRRGERAAELVAGTKLDDVAVRKKLARGRHRARSRLDRSDDPAGPAGRCPARAVRKTYEEQVEEPLRQAYAKIAKARFAIEGDQHLSRRHLHAAAGLRRGEGLQRGRQDSAALDDDWRALRARRRTTTTSRPSSCRSAGSSARTSSTSTRRSTSSARPTSSAATRPCPALLTVWPHRLDDGRIDKPSVA